MGEASIFQGEKNKSCLIATKTRECKDFFSSQNPDQPQGGAFMKLDVS